jgi:hypothetical protein
VPPMWDNLYPIGKRGRAGAVGLDDDAGNLDVDEGLSKHEASMLRDLTYLEGRNGFFTAIAARIRVFIAGGDNFAHAVSLEPPEVVKELCDYKFRQPASMASIVGKSSFAQELQIMKEAEQDASVAKRAIVSFYTTLFLKQFQKRGKVNWDVAISVLSDLRDAIVAHGAIAAAVRANAAAPIGGAPMAF